MKYQLKTSTTSRSVHKVVCSVLLLAISNLSESRQFNRDEANPAAEAIKKTEISSNKISYNDIVLRGKNFNISSHDLIVLLHIQKTGGTAFEKHLVSDLLIEEPCTCNLERRRCSCPRPNREAIGNRTFADSTWLLSRFATGWLCGLHPDWSSLTGCLSALKGLYFVTFLRNPIERFVSEFRHVQRGATWKTSKSRCMAYDTRLCYEGGDWSNVTIEEFINCGSNMAINRQTRMLAALDLTQCPKNPQELHSPSHERALLISAMNNLRRMAFFGLCEEQKASQIIFEKTFKLKFGTQFEQSEDNKTRIMIDRLSPDIKLKIAQVNNLDMDLHQYAVSMFWNRLEQIDVHNMNVSKSLQSYK